MHRFLLISSARRRDTNGTNTTNMTDMTKIEVENWDRTLFTVEDKEGSEVFISGGAVKRSKIDTTTTTNNNNNNNNGSVNGNDNNQ